MKQRLSMHSKKRLNTRFGLKHNDQKKLSNNAKKYGKSPMNMYDCWEKTFLMDRQKSSPSKVFKLYNGIVFIYSKNNGKLITAYKMPKEEPIDTE